MNQPLVDGEDVEPAVACGHRLVRDRHRDDHHAAAGGVRIAARAAWVARRQLREGNCRVAAHPCDARTGCRRERQQQPDHLGRGGRAVRRVLFQQPGDDRVQLGWHLAAQRGHRRGCLLDVLSQHLERGTAIERRRADEHLVQYAAEGVQVGGGGDRSLPCLFRRHVPGGAQGCVRAGQLVAAVDVVEDQADAEVQHLHHPAGGQHDVGRLHVPVHDACPVRGIQPSCGLRGDRGGPPDRQLPGLVEQFRQRDPVDVLHRQVRPVAVKAAGDRARQVRARQPLHDPHLAQEARGVLVRLGERHLLARAATPDQLHRNGLARLRLQVTGLEYLSHVAVPDRAEDLEPARDDVGLVERFHDAYPAAGTRSPADGVVQRIDRGTPLKYLIADRPRRSCLGCRRSPRPGPVLPAPCTHAAARTRLPSRPGAA